MATYAQTNINIGTGTTTGYMIPINNLYWYTYSQQIILASEIGMDGIIEKITFNFNGGSMSTNDDWKVYLGYKTGNQFSSTTDWLPLNQLTQVYSGIVATPSATGMTLEITLQSPFFYQQSMGNLVIAVDENAPNYSYTSTMFMMTSATNRSIYYRSDSNNPDPNSPPTGTLYSYHNNIRLTMSPAIACSTVALTGGTTSSTVSSVCAGANAVFTVSGAPTLIGTAYQWQSSTSGLPGSWVNLANGSFASYSGPVSATTNFRRRTVCAATNDTAYSTPYLVSIVPCQSMTNGSITTCGGYLYDSGGPTASYGNSENLTYTINPLPGNYLQAQFLSFALETCCDNLKIYDGPNTSYPLIGTYASTSPGTVLATNTTGALTFQFTSDGSVIYAGFEALLSCVPFPSDEVELLTIDNPSIGNCVLGNTLDVTVRNNGLNDITSLDFSVNSGGLTQNIVWTGLVPSLATQQITVPSSFFYNDGDTLTVTISNPNGVADNTSDNFIGIRTYLSLSGVYKVGYGINNTDSIADLSTAISRLNQRGACDTVYFDMKPGVYTGRYIINNYPNWVSGNKVVIRSETLNAQDVVFRDSATSATNNYVFRLDGGKGVGFNHVTINPRGATYRRAIDILNGAHEMWIDHCRILTDTTATGTSTTSFDQVVISSGNATQDNASVITNNYFKGGTRLINLGSSTTDYEQGHIISNNSFNNSLYIAVIVDRNNGLVFENNTIVTAPYSTINTGLPVCLSNIIGGRVNNNNIISNKPGHSLLLNSVQGNTNPFLVYNNFIYNADSSSNTNVGLRVELPASNNIVIANNSISSRTNSGSAVTIFDGNNIQLLNNNIASFGLAPVILMDKNYSVSNMNNNNLFNGTGVGILVRRGTNSYYTLSDWQTASNMDLASVSVHPGFNGSDLHTCAVALDGSAQALSFVVDDIDGDIRQTPSDIGADEFMATALGLVVDDQIEKCSNASVLIGAPAINGVTYSWSNGANTSEINVSTDGQYIVTATSNCGTFADTVQVSNTAATTISASIAAGNGLTVLLNNNSTNAISYSWNFGDGQTSTQANPTHMYAAPGTYVITLTAFGPCDTLTTTLTFIANNVSNEEFENARLNVYPNPAVESVNIEFDGEFNDLKVFDITGKLIYIQSLEMNIGIVNISVSDLNPGIYTVVLMGDSGSKAVKFVKK